MPDDVGDLTSASPATHLSNCDLEPATSVRRIIEAARIAAWS